MTNLLLIDNQDEFARFWLERVNALWPEGMHRWVTDTSTVETDSVDFVFVSLEMAHCESAIEFANWKVSLPKNARLVFIDRDDTPCYLERKFLHHWPCLPRKQLLPSLPYLIPYYSHERQEVAPVAPTERPRLSSVAEIGADLFDRLPLGLRVRNRYGEAVYKNAMLSRILEMKPAVGGIRYQLLGKGNAAQNVSERELVELVLQNNQSSKPFITGAELGSTIFQITFSSVQTKGRKEESWIVEIWRDVTEEVKAQKSLVNAQKMEAVGSLAGGIAHDFNNLLAGIMGYADLIKMLAKDTPAARYAETISKTSAKASDLTKQLVALTERREQSPKPMNLGTVVKNATKLIKAGIPRSGGFEVTDYHSHESGRIVGIPQQIQQLLVSFSKAVRDSLEHARLTLDCKDYHLEPTNEWVRRKNIDPGAYIGVHIRVEGDLGEFTLFEQFERLVEGKKKDFEVSGVSLQVAANIVQAHQCKVLIEKKGQSAQRLVLLFPKQEKTYEISSSDAIRMDNPWRILAVDDEEIIRRMLSVGLGRFGYEVETAESGLEALEILKERPEDFDLILLDMLMPGLTGAKTFYKIKELLANPQVIIFSGMADPGDVKDLLRDGALDYIQKPIRLPVLAQRLNDHFSRSQSGAQSIST